MLKLCRECRFHVVASQGSYELRCNNEEVNGGDPWALSSNRAWAHTNCRGEREKKWFAVCGIKGKKWERKVD